MNKIPSVQQLIFDVYTIYHTKKSYKTPSKLMDFIKNKYKIHTDKMYYSHIVGHHKNPLLELLVNIIRELITSTGLDNTKYNPNTQLENFSLDFFRKNQGYTLFLISHLHYDVLCHKIDKNNVIDKIQTEYTDFNNTLYPNKPDDFLIGLKDDMIKLLSFNFLVTQPMLNTTKPQIKEVIKEVEKIVEVEKIIEVEKPISPKQPKTDIKEQLLQQLKQLTPTQFEHFALYLISVITGEKEQNIKDLVIHNGQVGDGGVDGVFQMKNKFGTYDTYVIQCKRYDKASIGRPELQNFVGAMALYQTKQGLFITTSKFSKNVFDYIENVKHTYSILTMDGMKLVEYMIEHNIGVYDVTHIEKVIDTNFFDECKYQIS